MTGDPGDAVVADVPRQVAARVGRDGRELAAIFLGGAVGTALRAMLSNVLPLHPHEWPWATFTVNIAGAALLGYFATRLQERLPVSSYRRPLLGTGLCGGLTTFSTMQVETLRLVDDHDWALATGYVTASVVAGIAALHLATALVRRVRIPS